MGIFSGKILKVKNDSKVWDGIFIRITLDTHSHRNKKIVLGNLYRPPRQTAENISTFIDELSEIFHDLRNFTEIYIAGDFNLDLLKFRENAGTNSFLEFMISNNYFPKITLPTRITHQKGTLIDNYYVKMSENSSKFTSGVITSQISDHLPYFLDIEHLQLNNSKHKYIRVVSSGVNSYSEMKSDLNNEYYRNKMENVLSDSPNESYDNMDQILNQLTCKHFPVKFVKFNKYKYKKSRWITSGIMKSIRVKDKMYVHLKSIDRNSPSYETTLVNFKTYSRILKQMIKNAKKTFFSNCFENYKSDMKKTWETINGILNKNKNKNDLPECFHINEHEVNDARVISNEFNKYFVNIGPQLSSSIDNLNNGSFTDYLNNPTPYRFDFQPVTVENVVNIINSLKNKTSQSFDRISNKLLKYLKYELAPPLTKLFNQCIQHAIFPDSLKRAKIIPVYKQNEKHLFNNYRPISILSSVSKVFERIMCNQLYNYFDEKQILFKSQYGFRQHHSTELSTLELVDRISIAMDKNKLPLNVYLDLSKAFDTLDHEILVHKLGYYGISGQSLALLSNYLSNRTQQVEFNSIISDKLEISCGVPQGSILGPLLFILYMNDIVYSSDYFYPILYADDTTLCATLNISLDNNDNILLNRELNLVSKWLKLNKLSLNLSKTKAMLFSRQRTIPLPEIFIDSHQVEFVNNFKFLGIVLQQNLKWNTHVDMISKKISKTLGIMRRLKKIVPLKTMLNIYNALILPHLNYGIIIWGGQDSRLFKLQKSAVRTITNSKYNAHTTPIFKNLKLLKLTDICALQDYKFCYKYENLLLPKYFLTDMRCNRLRITSTTTRQFNSFRLPSVSHEFAKQAISFKFPKFFNNMNALIKDKIYTHSYDGFKKYVKFFFISTYDPICTIPNCYICHRPT